MEALVIYLLKSNALIALFFLAYHFLVRKETFFNTNRWFLLSGLLTSVALPVYFFKKIIWIEKPIINRQNLVVNSPQGSFPLQNTPIVEAFDWTQLICISYGIIAAVLVIKIIFNLASLYRMLYKKQVVKNDGFRLVKVNENIAPFSFFKYIVFNPDLYSTGELRSILLHEQIHSKQKHSVDVLLAELFCAVFWFNPFMWYYKKAITQNLEYIADQKAIEQIEDKKSYQHALLKVVSNKNCLPITNNFYQSLIKKRIVMLNKNQSQKRNSWKYAIVIPALIGFVFLFQIKTEAKEKFNSENRTTRLEKLSVTEKIWTKNTTDNQFRADVEIMAASNIIFDFTNILRNSKNEITSITISFSDELGNNSSNTFTNQNGIKPIHFIRDINNGKGQIGYLGDNDIQIVKQIQEETVTFSTTLVFDKISSDNELKSDAEQLKKDHDIKLTFSNLKRNDKGEILSIKISFDDNKGNKGKVEQSRTIPIRPIFFKASKLKDGKNVIGFYDNSDMETKPTDPVNENKIVTIESIKEDALIYVDGDRYDKESLNELDPKGLDKIEVLKDTESLQKYGAKDKGVVYVITTKWTTREHNIAVKQEQSPNIITLINGDEVVVFDKNNLKIVGYPAVSFSEKSPILVLDGVQQKNPRLTLEQMNITKIKTIKVLNEKDQEVEGTPIYKILITTK